MDDGFRVSSPWLYNAPNELYWDFPVIQGNQQSMHFSWLFNWAGQPWRTQKWNRDIVDRYYGFGVSNAYLGDEDQGQMSAWFVMSALGLFQTDGGTAMEPVYEIGSPLFERVVIDLGGRYGRGKTFTHRGGEHFLREQVRAVGHAERQAARQLLVFGTGITGRRGNYG